MQAGIALMGQHRETRAKRQKSDFEMTTQRENHDELLARD